MRTFEGASTSAALLYVLDTYDEKTALLSFVVDYLGSLHFIFGYLTLLMIKNQLNIMSILV